MKNNNSILIGIDPAFRTSGFAICVIDLTDRTVWFKMFKNGFLDFQSWFFNDSPDPKGVIVSVENSNLQNVTFWTHRHPNGSLLSKYQAMKVKGARLLSDAERDRASRDAGKNMATSQFVVDTCKSKYKVIDMSPKDKGGKWTTHKLFTQILKQEKLTYDKSTTNQDKRCAFKMAVIAKNRPYLAK